MQYYLAERYLPEHDRSEFAAETVRVRAATERAGKGLRFLQTVYIPGDELCFYLFEAGSADLVDRVIRDARLDFERILPAVAVFDRGGGAE
jgi:hypothetical protein